MRDGIIKIKAELNIPEDVWDGLKEMLIRKDLITDNSYSRSSDISPATLVALECRGNR